MRGVVVCHGGYQGVAVGGAAGGVVGRVTGWAAGGGEAPKVLSVDWLVTMQHSNGLVNLEPLPFSADADRVLPVLQSLGHGEDIDVRPVLPVLVVLENPQQPAKLSLYSSLFVHLSDSSTTWLLLWLHSSPRHNPLVWVATAAHQQHLVLLFVLET